MLNAPLREFFSPFIKKVDTLNNFPSLSFPGKFVIKSILSFDSFLLLYLSSNFLNVFGVALPNLKLQLDDLAISFPSSPSSKL